MVVGVVAFEGIETQFEVQNRSDHIQAFHARGQFYEIRQLLVHRDLIPMNSSVIDVGANVGNHTLFYARHTLAARVYPVEPNPPALCLLQRNVTANRNSRGAIDMSHVRFAIGRSSGHVQIGRELPDNLGGTSFVPQLVDSPSQAIECVRLDELRFEGHVGFVKVDVEGMETDVLWGAEQLIDRFRPAMAVEVAPGNHRDFWDWARAHRYNVVGAFRDYIQTWNYILIPCS
jgi:FkbM family methyltransferase